MTMLAQVSVEALSHAYRAAGALQDPNTPGQTSSKKVLDPTVLAFEKYIQKNSDLSKLCHSMFVEAKHLVHAERAHPSYLAINNTATLMQLLDFLLTRSPRWSDAQISSEPITWAPFNHILLVFLETPSGERLFLRDDVNYHLKAILGKWAVFLGSSPSRDVLSSQNGWLSPNAISRIEEAANMPTGHNRTFREIFECPDEADTQFLGFSSWKAFLSRRFKAGVRPLPSSQDVPCGHSPILNACESTPWQISRQCQLQDRFWLQSQPYSIPDMLGKDPLADHFANGTVYQASLSTLDYHRWHAPIDGIVRKILDVDGAYFTRRSGYDGMSLEGLHSFLATVAARTVVFIEAADPRIGLVAFVGMGSCHANVRDGEYVEAGQDIGAFGFGEATYCLVFGEHVNLRFVSQVDGERKGCNIPVRSLLAWC